MNITPDQTTPLRNPSKSEVAELLVELDESGLGVAAFARARRLKPQNLYVARRRREAPKAPAPIFDPVHIVDGDEGSQPFKVELASGFKIEVPIDFDSAGLRRLLDFLNAC